MCEFVGWCVLFSAEWVDAIGSVIGGLGAMAAAWTSVMIARSIRRTDDKRRAADATALLRLITPEMSVLPVKLHRYLSDLEETRDWWGDARNRAVAHPPQLLRTTLDRLSEDFIPHTTAAADRLSVLDDLNYASIANDAATTIATVSGIREAAMLAKFELENGADDLDVTLGKLINMTRFFRGLAAQLANEMQPTIGMSKTDYSEKFGQ